MYSFFKQLILTHSDTLGKQAAIIKATRLSIGSAKTSFSRIRGRIFFEKKACEVNLFKKKGCEKNSFKKKRAMNYSSENIKAKTIIFQEKGRGRVKTKFSQMRLHSHIRGVNSFEGRTGFGIFRDF